jgi:hypothetical protein
MPMIDNTMRRAFLTMLRGIRVGLTILALTCSGVLLVSGTAIAQSAGQCTTKCVKECIGAQNPTVCEAICQRNFPPSARRTFAKLYANATAVDAIHDRPD